MPTTPEKALETARAYAALHRPGRTVLRLLEDPEDYLAVLSPHPNGEELGGWVIFIRKADGTPWEKASVLEMTKIHQMTAVPSEAP